MSAVATCPLDVRTAEPSEKNAAGFPAAGELGESLCQRVGSAKLDIAIGPQDQDSRSGQLSCQELQKQ